MDASWVLITVLDCGLSQLRIEQKKK